jgi:uncharacterized protein (TIGR03435 family)
MTGRITASAAETPRRVKLPDSRRPCVVARPVLDKIGLVGTFDIHLAWTPDEATRALTGSEDANGGGTVTASADIAATSIFNALTEQLGLKLEATKGPVDVIVIDHVVRPEPN